MKLNPDLESSPKVVPILDNHLLLDQGGIQYSCQPFWLTVTHTPVGACQAAANG
jgi:hypothetical protein